MIRIELHGAGDHLAALFLIVWFVWFVVASFRARNRADRLQARVDELEWERRWDGEQ